VKDLTIHDFERIFKNRQAKSLSNYRYFSVLVPLVEKDGELYLLYEVRSDSLKRQPGEVCFPGGRMENDESAEECAIRETIEELNIEVNDIRIIAQLDYIHTYSNFTLYSFLGVIDYEAVKNMSVNQDEVKEVFLVPVSYLEETKPEIYIFDVTPNVGDDFPYERINSVTGYNWRKGRTVIPIYQYNERVIWGLTGRMTYHLVELIKDKNEG
jgi:ADP-ribose pyrophosphatase